MVRAIGVGGSGRDMSDKEKAAYPPIYVKSFATMNNLERNVIAIHFESGNMQSQLVFTPKLAKELIIGLKKSLARLKARQN